MIPLQPHSAFISPRDFGATGDGTTLDTHAVQSAFDAAHAQGGGTVFFSPGIYLCGTLQLRSRVAVRIGAGATLQASPRAVDFEFIKPKIWSRMDTSVFRSFIYAEDLEDITLSGDGTIDGGGLSPEFSVKPKDNDPNRPYCLHMVNCHRVTVRDLRLQNSAFWMQRYLHCDDVRLTGLRNHNHATFNNDGMDIDSSSNVTISDCIFDVSDDAICLKSEGRGVTRNIVVTNCILATHASAIKLGTGSVGGFENVVVSNCVIRPSQSKKIVHGLFALGLEAPGGLTGIDLGSVDGGTLRHCLFSNIIMEGVESPFCLRLGNRNSARMESTYGINTETNQEERTSRLEHIVFDNIDAREGGPYTSPITGFEGHPIRDITFRNVTLRNSRPPKPDEQAKPYAHHSRSYPGSRSGGHMPASGLFFDHVEGVILDNVRVYPAEGDARPPFVFSHTRDVSFDRVPQPSEK